MTTTSLHRMAKAFACGALLLSLCILPTGAAFAERLFPPLDATGTVDCAVNAGDKVLLWDTSNGGRVRCDEKANVFSTLWECSPGQYITKIVNGEPQCKNIVRAAIACPANEYLTGINTDGSAVCKPMNP